MREKEFALACSDIVPRRLRFVTDGIIAFEPAFEPAVKVSIDVASEKLLGTKYENEAHDFDYCIDHHYTNTHYAKKTVVCPDASSAGEVLFMLLEQTGTTIDAKTGGISVYRNIFRHGLLQIFERSPADSPRGGEAYFFRL